MTTLSDIFEQRAERLRRFRVEALGEGSSAAAMARRLGIPASTYRALENGTRPIDEEWAIKIARGISKTTNDILYGGSDLPAEYKKTVVFNSVPILSLDGIGEVDMKKLIAGSKDFFPAPPIHDIGTSAFAVPATDDSMEPEFRTGAVIIFDPDSEWKPNDYVLAYVNSVQKHVIRQCKWTDVDANGNAVIDLLPLNDAYPKFQIINGVTGNIVARLIMAVSVY